MNTSYYIVKWKKWFYQDMPEAETSLGWHEWKVKAKKNKMRWFLADTFPTWVSSTFIWPVQRKRDELRMRFVKKTWRIDIPTLDKYDYHENDSVMLHGMFHLLTEFVEGEKAWMQHISNSWKDEDDDFMDNVKKARKNKVKWKDANKRELAFKHLDWEIGLGEEGGLNQSSTAKEVKELYIWWKDIRPNRPDPMDVKGDKGISWTEYCAIDKPRYDDEGNELDFLARHEFENEEEKEIGNSASKAMYDAEEQYDKEDEEMLIRLVKIRKGMWT